MVARMSIHDHPVVDPEVTTILTYEGNISLSKPNGLYLDTDAEELYIGDGDKRKIIKCQVSSKCQIIHGKNSINCFK